MSDIVVLLAIAAVVAAVGIGAGILLARPISRAMERADEPDDDGAIGADPPVPRPAPLGGIDDEGDV